MLQILVCSDVHTYTNNIRLAIEKPDRVDAVLLAGDQEAELDEILAACGDIPCYAVSGNNDYYLNTDYPEELLIDISNNISSPGEALNSTPNNISSSVDPLNSTPENTTCPEQFPIDNSEKAKITFSGPRIVKVTETGYNTVPEKDTATVSDPHSPLSALSSFFFKLFNPSQQKNGRQPLPGGLAFPVNTVKRPADISHRILMTHGKEYNVPDITLLTRRARILDADIVIFGHTHKFWYTTAHGGKIRLINPGCLVGDPRASVRVFGNYEICSFAVLRIGDNGEIHVEHLYL
jgi:predicted phosphodiesterase